MQWNADLYDSKHTFVTNYGEDLIELLRPKQEEVILDLGCGTGGITEKIQSLCKHVIGIDNSVEMIQKAKQTYHEIEFVCTDARNFSFDTPFDAVFSNAVLHWIPEKEAVLKNVYNHLKNNGRFVAEFGGKGNNDKMLDALRNVLKNHGYARNAEINFWYYPSIGEYATVLENAGFRVTLAFHFDRQTKLEGENGIVNWFTMFGNNFFKGIADNKIETILKETQEMLYPSHYINGSWFADYKRIRVVAIKEM